MYHNPENNRHRRENNPHFSPLQPPPQPRPQDQHTQPPQPRQQGQTNPHFSPVQPPPQLRAQHEDQHSQPLQPRQQGQTNPHFSPVQPPPQLRAQHEDQHSQPLQPRQQGQHSQPHGPQEMPPQHQGQQPSPKERRPRRGKSWSSPWAPKPQHQAQQPGGPSQPQHQAQQPKVQPQGQPPWTYPPLPQHQAQQPSGPSQPQHQAQQPKVQPQGQPPWTSPPPPQHQDQHPTGPSQPQHQGQQSSPWVKPSPQGQQSGPHVLSPQYQDHRFGQLMPRPRSTNCITWFTAAFCAIFWVVIILGGLVVLIVYLVFRPRSPQFDISSATLNSAYLDMGYLLNADLTVFANFTNPNKKVSVDFSYVTLDLYHANTLIATQYIEPFKALKKESKFADVHMVTSQVRLPIQDSELLQKQIDNSRILFEVKGVFHARSILGNFLGYSYRLYAHCNIMVTSPPSGVLRARKCKTKR